MRPITLALALALALTPNPKSTEELTSYCTAAGERQNEKRCSDR